MKLVDHDDFSEVSISRGVIRISPEQRTTQIELFETDTIGGQVLRDLLDTLAQDFDLPLSWAERKPKGLPATLSLARVIESRAVSPAFHRLIVTGPDLARFGSGGLHFTLPQGPEGAGWPYTDEGGVTRWPEGITAWHRPVFTTREIAETDGEVYLTFDVFLHADGRTPGWVSELSEGDEIALMGPSGSAMPKPTTYLAIVADETAVPVAARILSQTPAETVGHVILFVPEEADIQTMAAPDGIKVEWALRGSGDTPVAALDRLELPTDNRYVLFAAEKSEAAAAKDVLANKGLVRGEFLAASYWSAS